jgi:hypothetical protein
MIFDSNNVNFLIEQDNEAVNNISSRTAFYYPTKFKLFSNHIDKNKYRKISDRVFIWENDPRGSLNIQQFYLFMLLYSLPKSIKYDKMQEIYTMSRSNNIWEFNRNVSFLKSNLFVSIVRDSQDKLSINCFDNKGKLVGLHKNVKSRSIFVHKKTKN